MKNDPLGDNPLSKSIFSRTTPKEEVKNQEPETRNQKPESVSQEPEARNQKPEAVFLRDGDKVKITVQLDENLNEWIDYLVKNGRKKHGHKIQKQTWIQAALELMQVIPIDWASIETPEQLQEELEKVAKTLKARNHKP